jgi:acyl-CoA synthetase (AMP-forming)/AMP-acid ligase II
MVIRSPYADVHIPEISLCELLFADLGERADAPAFIDGGSGASVSYAELAGQVERVAAALTDRGIGAGHVVGIFAPNSPQWVAAFHGVLRANATVTSVNSLYSAGEVAHQLRDSGARLLFTISAFLDRATEAMRDAGRSADEIIVLDDAAGHTSLSELLATTAEPPALTARPGDTAVLPYSSGTTGRGKGVILTHRNLVANLCQVEPVFKIGPDARILAVLPFFHIYGMTVMMNNGLYRRATVVTMPRFDLAEFLRVIATHRVSTVYIAPPIAVALAKHPMVDSYDLSCVENILSGAAPLDAELGHAVAKRLGCQVRQGYGMTELSPVSHAIPRDAPEMDLGSVGVALPNTECKLVDPETGTEIGPGGRGELWVRGPNVMAGYLNNPEATAITLDAEGYLHTGDVAEVTEDGVFTIVDRVKELIKYKGYQVPPAELEALLLTHDGIADVAVIGVRDADGEEVPKAFVVRQPGAEVTGEDVMTFVGRRSDPHQKIRVVEFIEQIPKSAAGKILRKDLRAREAASG